MGLQNAGPRGGVDAVFIDSVARAAVLWMSLLEGPAGRATIAHEASELAGVARVRGFAEIGDLLTRIQKLAGSRSEDLQAALVQLRGWVATQGAGAAPLDRKHVMRPSGSPPPVTPLPPAPAPPGMSVPLPPAAASPGMSVPLPPMLDQTSRMAGLSGLAKPPAPDPAAANAPSQIPPAPRLPSSLPDPAAEPAQPQLVVKKMLGLRAFKKDAPSSPAPPMSAPPAGGAGLLGLAARRRAPMPPVAAHPPPNDFADDTQRRRPGGRAPARPPARNPRAQRLPPWAFVVGGALGVLAIATLAAVLLAAKAPAVKPAPAASETVARAAPSHVAAGGATPETSATAPAIDVARLAEAAHEQGPETPELRALIEAETRIAASCREDPSRCARGWAKRSREVLESPDPGALSKPSPPTEGPASAWLLRLKVPPDCSVRDEPSLRGVFDYESKNISGRQQFQQKIFECAAYADIFESIFIKYGAPIWLTAVVFQESGCDPRAASPVGARGLWQFMPDAGRAYGLRVVEDDVDERLNPVKSTEAGVHFLTDLKRKLGSWDLALAAYNMGPFGVATRIAQVGGHATFWDLAHAGLLPDETAAYVPAIQAHALILANLGRLQFSSDGKHLESTAEILVKPGTRLSLIARAAATSTLRIRQLNPEFLRDVVPDGEASARVPDAEAHRAQTFLEQRTADDERDLCVPDDFDWGTKPFETSKYAAACARGKPASH